MIKLVSKRTLGEGLDYHRYEADNYKISIAYMDGKLANIDVVSKKYMLPDIVVDVRNNCEISMHYEMLYINDEGRQKFLDGYDTTVKFIDEELKPFINDIKNKSLDQSSTL